jgi:hypothetical protein
MESNIAYELHCIVQVVKYKYPRILHGSRQGVTEAVRGAKDAPDLPKPTMADHTTTDDDEKASDDGRLDPRVREHVEEHGSPAHGYDHSPERVSRDNRQRERGDR